MLIVFKLFSFFYGRITATFQFYFWSIYHLSAAKQQLCFPEKPQPQSEEKNRVS